MSAQPDCLQPSAMPLTMSECSCGFELARGEVVEEEEGLRALDDDVVHAHGHEVDADRVVSVREEGDLELGAHAVGAGDQDRVLVFFKRKEAAEAADVRHDLGPEGGFYKGFYLLDKKVPGVDVDTRIFIGYCHTPSSLNFSTIVPIIAMSVNRFYGDEK